MITYMICILFLIVIVLFIKHFIEQKRKTVHIEVIDAKEEQNFINIEIIKKER